jgi:hypothetical protein
MFSTGVPVLKQWLSAAKICWTGWLIMGGLMPEPSLSVGDQSSSRAHAQPTSPLDDCVPAQTYVPLWAGDSSQKSPPTFLSLCVGCGDGGTPNSRRSAIEPREGAE